MIVAMRLADDDDGLTFGDAVDQRHQPAAHREEPERHRHHALVRARSLRDPLHQEARGEQQLRDQPEGQPEIELGDEDVVEIIAERLPVLDQSSDVTSVATGVGFLRRISHHTPARSMIPIHSRSKKP